jgi:hypothetical protein
VLRPALHVGVHAARSQITGQAGAEGLDALLALDARLVEQPRDLPVRLGFEKAERQVFKLPLDLPDAEPVRQRREHLQRFGRQRARARSLRRGEEAQRLQP